MFGVDDANLQFPVSMDNMRLSCNTNAVPPVQLDALIGYNVDMMGKIVEKNASLVNLPMKLGRGVPLFSQKNLPITPHDHVCLDGATQAKSLLKQIPVSTGLRLSYGEEHNSTVSSAGEKMRSNVSSVLPQIDYLQTELVRQNDEFDQYITVQEENIRNGIAELKHRHTISLLNALEKEVNCKLHEKDTEIENLNRKNKELTEKIRQVAVEAQSWHCRAKQNESLVNFLRSNINQVFLQGAVCLKEGCGESMVDDAISSCNQNPLDPMDNLECLPSTKEPMNCKACEGKEISVLLLPCRHLCLCIECDAFINSCPVCQIKKAGSLQVYMC